MVSIFEPSGSSSDVLTRHDGSMPTTTIASDSLVRLLGFVRIRQRLFFGRWRVFGRWWWSDRLRLRLVGRRRRGRLRLRLVRRWRSGRLRQRLVGRRRRGRLRLRLVRRWRKGRSHLRLHLWRGNDFLKHTHVTVNAKKLTIIPLEWFLQSPQMKGKLSPPMNTNLAAKPWWKHYTPEELKTAEAEKAQL